MNNEYTTVVEQINEELCAILNLACNLDPSYGPTLRPLTTAVVQRAKEWKIDGQGRLFGVFRLDEDNLKKVEKLSIHLHKGEYNVLPYAG